MRKNKVGQRRKAVTAATQTESQIISSFLIRDDREKQERQREREKKPYKERKKKKREERIIHSFIVILVNTRQRKLTQFMVIPNVMCDNPSIHFNT